MQNVKQHFLTVDGVLITALHLFVLVGVLTSVIGFRIYVLGTSPLPATQTTTAKK